MAFQEKLCRALNCDELSSHGIVQIVYSVVHSIAPI